MSDSFETQHNYSTTHYIELQCSSGEHELQTEFDVACIDCVPCYCMTLYQLNRLQSVKCENYRVRNEAVMPIFKKAYDSTIRAKGLRKITTISFRIIDPQLRRQTS